MSFRLLSVVLFAAILFPLASGADEESDKAAKKLEGTYTVIEGIRSGKPEPKAKEIEAVIIKDGMMTIKGGKKEESVKITLDPSKKPAHIDIVPPRGKKNVQGIYEEKETDKGLQLTIAFTRNGGERPKDFKGEGENAMVLKMLRKKEK